MTFWIVPLLWECQTMKRNTVISALVGSVSSQFHGLLSLQYVSTQKQKVISSAGSHSAFSLGQHFPLPSGPPIWPRIPGAAVSEGGEAAITGRLRLSFVTHRTVLLQPVPHPPWAHTASTVNCATSDGSSPSLGPHCLHWELVNTEVLHRVTVQTWGTICSPLLETSMVRCVLEFKEL